MNTTTSHHTPFNQPVHQLLHVVTLSQGGESENNDTLHQPQLKLTHPNIRVIHQNQKYMPPSDTNAITF